MALAVISYPKFNKEDLRLIQAFRKDNDLYFNIVDPHFTFVFPVFDVEKQRFIDEIMEKSTGVRSFDFEIRCAAVNRDPFSDYYHLLLEPDKGFSNIVKLHDRFYSGLLFNNLRLDIDFIPHMGIGNSKDPLVVKRWVDEWNGKDFLIAGRVESLVIVDFTDMVLTDLVEIKLR